MREGKIEDKILKEVITVLLKYKKDYKIRHKKSKR